MKNYRNSKAYLQHKGKVVDPEKEFKYVMAITLDPTNSYTEGLLRCIVHREGSVHVSGFLDRSKLYKVQGSSLEHFHIKEPLVIKNEDNIIKKICGSTGDCIGLEDPDIWVDDANGEMHLYFTIPIFFNAPTKGTIASLGHAVGKDLNNLTMTDPVLLGNTTYSAKEVCIAPLNKKGFRYNLIESRDKLGDEHYSTVQVAVAKDMNGPWEYGKVAFHPNDKEFLWIAEDASPGPMFPKSFIDPGEGKMLGIMNGRAKSVRLPDGRKRRGIFSIGLFIYDYEEGNIEWVSHEPLIQDTEAETITFASQFVLTENGEGILYAHVDDSFVRAYTLYPEELKKLLP